MSVTVNDIRNGVISALKQQFPMKIYGEEIKQGFTKPCFFVKLFPVEHSREVDRRYLRVHSFDIHYFGTSNEDMHDTAESLYDILEYITVTDGLCRGKSMKHEIVDETLHFFVDYDFHVMRQKVAEPKMQTMEANVKDG